MAVMLHISLHNTYFVTVQTDLLHTAPQYLHPFSAVTPLRSSVTNSLFIPAVRLPTVGCRTFPGADARICINLPWDPPHRRCSRL